MVNVLKYVNITNVNILLSLNRIPLKLLDCKANPVKYFNRKTKLNVLNSVSATWINVLNTNNKCGKLRNCSSIEHYKALNMTNLNILKSVNVTPRNVQT